MQTPTSQDFWAGNYYEVDSARSGMLSVNVNVIRAVMGIVFDYAGWSGENGSAISASETCLDRAIVLQTPYDNEGVYLMCILLKTAFLMGIADVFRMRYGWTWDCAM